jgi:hypothetical protein
LAVIAFAVPIAAIANRVDPVGRIIYTLISSRLASSAGAAGVVSSFAFICKAVAIQEAVRLSVVEVITSVAVTVDPSNWIVNTIYKRRVARWWRSGHSTARTATTLEALEC